jgi:hypothetical protein
MPHRPALDIQQNDQSSQPSPPEISAIILPFQSQTTPDELRPFDRMRRLVSTRELSAIWGVPESTLRYWRCAELGPPYVKLGGRIKYDLADVESYVRANKRMPSVRAHGG